MGAAAARVKEVKIGHVAVSVVDLDRSISFYRRICGLVCKKKYRHPEIGLTIALLKKGDCALELFAFKKHIPLPKYRKTLDSDLRTLGVKHFSVESADIESAYKKLKKAKVRFATGLRVFDDGKRYFFIKDPDGALIEVMEG